MKENRKLENKQIKNGLARFTPIAASILLSMPFIVNAADISMSNGSVASANGVPVININEANANGISHNIYDKLNVGKEGLIFNNSQNAVNTTLAGQIAGNSNLASGTAKVILNEVTSTNKSALNGMMEVAGDKAHLIIANPNGITCSGCGFINAEKVTVTTGKPDMQNGELKGYSVSGGVITTDGLTSDSPTALLARSVTVNGDMNVAGNGITVIAGNNYVDVNNQVTGTVKATGSRNTYGIDVAKLGGMYADKINLVSTESGVGVRNLGVLSAGSGGIQIDTNGALINSNAQIKSSGAINMKTNGALTNVTGKILSDKSISIDTNKNQIDNSRAGNIMSGADLYIGSGAINNTNGKLAATGVLGIDTNNGTLTNSGKGKTVGITAGVVSLKTGTLNNNNGQITGYYVGTQSTSVNNSQGTIDSYGDVDIASTGAVNNNNGLIRSANGHVKIDASKNTVTNSSTKTADTSSGDSLGIIAGAGGIEISSATLNNNSGQIASNGDIKLLNTANVNNASGKILTDKSISIQAASLNNSQAGLSAKTGINVELTSGALDNNIGVLLSDGDINVTASRINNTGGIVHGQNVNLTTSGDVNNSAALMVADKKLTINAGGTVDNQNSKSFYGLYLGMPNQEGGMVGKGGVDITANALKNNNSRIIAQGSPLNLTVAKTIDNDRSMLVAGAGASKIKAGTLNTNYSTIYSAGDLAIDVNSLNMSSSGNMIDNNATGIISADGALVLNVFNSFTNYGWINGVDSVNVSTEGILYNRNTINSDNAVSVHGTVGINNYNDIVAGNTLNVTSSGAVNNTGTLYTDGKASIAAKTVSSLGSSTVLGGRQGLNLNVNSITYSGKVFGL
ncbi:filamentous hemagglutinin N-terminal domain-containing protein [Rahnella sp. LAC-M12]|uniref:Filamentous hemagglutinin N-terminal domain-containing protein n=2 Tax=Yersiniaceae TaxID=1903411 RepID=A0ABS0E0S0_9GAMM|nr:filamentous hemagglutinin N-terminal domain-containing protein [Rahnella laticis]MBF7998788.1 filamentous hemagglutinin N-terminal domain-containing protein [Rahnella sp. LAC-M12]